MRSVCNGSRSCAMVRGCALEVVRVLPVVTLALVAGLVGCEPFEEDSPGLGGLSAKPAMRVEPLADNPNLVVVEDLSEGFFARTWDLPGATPNTSTARVDTVLYVAAGTYEVSLYGSAEGGGGVAVSSETIVIERDAENQCSDELTLLAGGCGEASQKCWTFTRAADAVRVGPVPGSGEWFRSTENGLQEEQYDDAFCFSFSGSAFRYFNNGLTVDPNQGFSPVPYEPLEGQTYTLLPGGGEDGETRIQLPDGNFIGLLDASTAYDIVTLTETELVLRTPFANGEGWFELTLEPAP